MRRLTFAVLLLAFGQLVFGDDSERLLTIDHYVRVKSTVPALAGQEVPIYVRERVQAGTALRGAAGADRIALFVHGTPAKWRSTCRSPTTAGWRFWRAPASTPSRWTRPATAARSGPRR